MRRARSSAESKRRTADAVQVESPGRLHARPAPRDRKAVGPPYDAGHVEAYARAHKSAAADVPPNPKKVGDPGPWQSVRVVLPYPPTANNLYPTMQTRRGPRRVRSVELQRYHTVVANACQEQAVECFPRHVELEVTYLVYMPIRSDLDNRIKAVQDALKGRLWADDRQIGAFRAERFGRHPTHPEGVVIVVARERRWE